MSKELCVDLSLMNEKVKFHAVSALRPDQGIIFDFQPPVGDGEGFLGLEVLLLGFAGCVSTSITTLLRRMGNTVTHYEMRALATRKENQYSLEKIDAVITLNKDGVNTEDVQKAIDRASLVSPVWLAIKNNVEVKIDFKLL
ncbi:MAG TPA: OsmC family protein [Clostridia bacterium]|nr:OsmC family protein [Clostridia bacterium]